MPITEPRKDELVRNPCKFCRREPWTGERYGPGADQWDFTDICPECWDRTMGDDEEDEDAIEAEVADEIAVDGALYEEMTGKTLGSK